MNRHEPSPRRNPDLRHADLVSSGERELAAFYAAVTELYGAEQARVAAEQWLKAVNLIDCDSQFPRRSWRGVTIAATAQLLDRFTGQPLRHSASASGCER